MTGPSDTRSRVTLSQLTPIVTEPTDYHSQVTQSLRQLTGTDVTGKSLSQTVEIKPRDMFVSAVQKQKEILDVEGEVVMCRDDVLAVFQMLS